MSRLPGYIALTAAVVVLAASMTAVAVAAAADEPPASVRVTETHLPAYGTTPTAGYADADDGHRQNRRGRGHGSRSHDGHDGRSHS